MFGKGAAGNTYYYGSDTYKHIDHLLGRGNEILIVSPYIDKYYAGILLDRSKGRKLYLISSSMDSDALKMLQGGTRLWIIGYLALSLAILSLLYFIGAYGAILLVSAIPLAVGIIRNSGRGSGISLKVPRRFVHAKMYISDDMAITGSANLTYKGTHKNVEQINITYSKESIDGLRKQFWELWKGP